jgi:hypothetical protein
MCFSGQIHKQMCEVSKMFPLFMLISGRPLGRPSCTWQDNIRKYLWDIGSEGGNWVDQAQDSVQWWAVVMMVMNCKRLVTNIHSTFHACGYSSKNGQSAFKFPVKTHYFCGTLISFIFPKSAYIKMSTLLE